MIHRVTQRALVVCGFLLTAVGFATATNSATITSPVATITLHMPDGSAKSFPVRGQEGITVERAMQLARIRYTVSYYGSVGYVLMQANDQPPQTNGELKRGEPFWLLCVNDRNPHIGMSSVKLKANDRVDWYWTTNGQDKCPMDSS